MGERRGVSPTCPAGESDTSGLRLDARPFTTFPDLSPPASSIRARAARTVPAVSAPARRGFWPGPVPVFAADGSMSTTSPFSGHAITSCQRRLAPTAERIFGLRCPCSTRHTSAALTPLAGHRCQQVVLTRRACCRTVGGFPPPPSDFELAFLTSKDRLCTRSRKHPIAGDDGHRTHRRVGLRAMDGCTSMSR